MKHLTRTERHADSGSERGAVFVELAIVVPLLVALVMAIVDYGVTFDQSVGLRGGIREAVWNGGRGIVGAPTGPDCDLTFGEVKSDDNSRRLICMAKRRSGLDARDVRVKVRRITVGATDALMVCAMRRTSSKTRFYSELLDGVQRARLTSVLIVDPNTVAAGAAEVPFAEAPGGWAFCDPHEPAPG